VHFNQCIGRLDCLNDISCVSELNNDEIWASFSERILWIYQKKGKLVLLVDYTRRKGSESE